MAWKIATNSAFSGWDACRSGYVTPTFMNHALYTSLCASKAKSYMYIICNTLIYLSVI